MNNFFTQFNSQESIAILFFLIVAFLFGLLVGYLLRSLKVKELRRAAEEAEKKAEEAHGQVVALKEQLDLLNADVKKAMFEAEEQLARASRLEEDNNRQYHEMLSLNAEIERLRQANTALNAHLEDLNHQVLGLKAQDSTAPPPAEAHVVAAAPTQNEALSEALNRLESIVQKLSQLEAENAELRTQLADALARIEPLTAAASLQSASIAFDLAQEQEADPEQIFAHGKEVLQEKIAVNATAPQKDDLTRINGIGPFIEQKLNEQGIYTYAQISEWDAATIGQITEAIGYFPGRIERDNWVGQALELAQLKQKNPEAFSMEALATAEPTLEDLKVVEGIGPKIEELLHTSGIRNLNDLAETSVERLSQILEEAGGHFRMHTPDTWPAQARLASNGDWELLREYQEQLKGGREVN